MVSISSMRSRKRAPASRAIFSLSKAEKAWPRGRRPLGLGAKRKIPELMTVPGGAMLYNTRHVQDHRDRSGSGGRGSMADLLRAALFPHHRGEWPAAAAAGARRAAGPPAHHHRADDLAQGGRCHLAAARA